MVLSPIYATCTADVVVCWFFLEIVTFLFEPAAYSMFSATHIEIHRMPKKKYGNNFGENRKREKRRRKKNDKKQNLINRHFY